METPIRIGALRWPIRLYQRVDATDTATPTSTGLVESQIDSIETMADVQPVGPLIYFGSINAEEGMKVTHRVFIRWLPLVDINYAIDRVLTTPDGQTRTETFRVWRIMEIEGKQRFNQFDCQLQTTVYR
jgi:hypothetical protein